MSATTAKPRAGLAASPASPSAPSPGHRRRLRTLGPAAVLLLALVGLWQLLVTVLAVAPAVLPSPTLIVRSTWADRLNLWPAVTTTTKEAILGIVVAVIVAAAAAVAIDSSRPVRHSLYPLLVGSQTLPIIALAPLVVIWVGFGLAPKIALVALFSFFPIAVGLVSGLASADPEATNLLRTMGAGRLQLLWRVRLPSALPQFFTGLKISVTYAYTSAIVAEFVGAEQGLGVYMTTSKNAAPIRTDLVFGAVLVTALLTVGLFVLVGVAERLAMPWRQRATR